MAGQPATVWMDQSPPQFGAVAGDRAGLATCLGLGERDLLPDEDARVVSTGAAHLPVPAGDRAAVDRAAPDTPRLKSRLRQVGAEGCYLYSRDPVDAAGAVAYARFFNPTVGIAEDPATGTAAGPLAARLVAKGKIPDESTVIIEQGYALGRPSRIAGSVSGQRVRADEIALLAEHGLTTGQAIAAAGSLARDFLGIHPDGDIVTYDDDPLEDPGVLARPAAVVVRGVRVR
jgi:trans-2,3-dihydro-3-hydroxyanthranilate isomerase